MLARIIFVFVFVSLCRSVYELWILYLPKARLISPAIYKYIYLCLWIFPFLFHLLFVCLAAAASSSSLMIYKYFLGLHLAKAPEFIVAFFVFMEPNKKQKPTTHTIREIRSPFCVVVWIAHDCIAANRMEIVIFGISINFLRKKRLFPQVHHMRNFPACKREVFLQSKTNLNTFEMTNEILCFFWVGSGAQKKP